jgi:hypothetical protein
MTTEQPTKARVLRPRQIRELYGIPQSSLHFFCTGLPEGERLPSIKLPGRRGTKGCRLVRVEDLEAWLARHAVGTAG